MRQPCIIDINKTHTGVMNMIEIYLLEQLEAFARCGTLSAAAEELHLSQPALTRSMKKLEDVIGVQLFERGKNKLSLNENGKLAAEYARRVLEQDREIAERVRAFDRASHTISIGACAPVPLEQIVPQVTSLYEGMTVSQELRPDAPLLEGLRDGTYQLIVLHEEPTDEALYWAPCGEEQLYITLPKAHPMAGRDGIWLKELANMNILLFSQIGFWYELCLEKIPNPQFLMQNDYQAFGTLVQASNLPVFTSSHFLQNPNIPHDDSRVVIPLLDDETHVRYYLACKSGDRKRFAPLFKRLSE